MNIWILTIGSSDVQLKPGNSWQKLFKISRSRLSPDRGFSPTAGIKGRFQAPARVIGVTYSQPEADQEFDDLAFPLIDNFIGQIKGDKIDKIILVLSDQSVFSLAERSSQHHPYWQDTCTLQPVLEKYFKKELQDGSHSLQIQPLFLKPTSTAEGLDDWNGVLRLVQDEFSCLEFPDNATIYVSHQAGTPAISSAIQFTSLSRFGQQVKFLVSNERDANLTRILPSSEYLKGIRKKEAEALLSTYNYAGVEALLKDELEHNEEAKTLLNAAKNWNVAKFGDFLECLGHHSKFASDVEARTKKENWWWIAYEEAYLAVIREKQDNIVEAFFHSFRVFEYIFAEWGSQKLTGHIEKAEEGDSVPYLMDSILDDPRILGLSGKSKKPVSGIISKLKKLRENKAKIDLNDDDEVELVFFNLANLFKAFNYSEYKKSCQELEIFFGKDNVRDRRNIIIHQVKGLSVIDLCNYWGISCPEDTDDWKECIDKWKSKLLKLLNFIVKEDFPEGFNTLENASLMAKVHEKLESAIAQL
jgi:hypothetical protein